jgi:hypothetical protein
MEPELLEYLDRRFDKVDSKQDDLETCLVGDGTAENPGIAGRVDRLEQTEKKRQRTVKAVVAAVSVAVAESFHSLFFRGGG